MLKLIVLLKGKKLISNRNKEKIQNGRYYTGSKK